MMNKISLVGRISKDPENSVSTTGVQVCRFNVACKGKQKDENGEIKTDFFICIAWREKAKLIETHCKKGDLLQIMGTMASRSFKRQDGTSQTIWEVNVEDLEFLTIKTDREGATKNKQTQPTLTPVDDDENLPF